MRVLLTGSAGRIGQAIRLELLRRGHAVLGLDCRASATTDIVADLCDTAAWQHALAGVGAVVHTAALHAPQVGLLPDAQFQRVNVDGTRHLIAAAQRHGVPHIVYTSTTALYGASSGGPAQEQAAWLDERSLPQPVTIYHRSKLAAEQCLKDASMRGGPAVTVLRMSRCFAEPAPLMAVYRLHRGVDARDVALAHALALERGPAAEAQTLVISGATPFVRADAAGLLHHAPSVLSRRAPALCAAFAERGWPLPSRIDRVYDAGAAQAALGWVPLHGFAEVLRQGDAGSAEVLPATA